MKEIEAEFSLGEPTKKPKCIKYLYLIINSKCGRPTGEKCKKMEEKITPILVGAN